MKHRQPTVSLSTTIGVVDHVWPLTSASLSNLGLGQYPRSTRFGVPHIVQVYCYFRATTSTVMMAKRLQR